MNDDERSFREAADRLSIDVRPNPMHKARLRRQMLAAFEQAAEPLPGAADRSGPRRIPLLRRPLVRLAAAAVILVGAFGTWRVLGPGGPATVSQICQATRKMPWLHAVATEYADDDVRTQQHWVDFSDKQTYVLRGDGTVLNWDYGADGKKFTYSPRVRAVAVSDLSGPGMFGTPSAHNLVDAFEVLAGDGAVRQWDEQHEGESVRSYEVEKARPGISLGGKDVAGLRMKVMVDPETRRIVAAEIEHQAATGVTLLREEWVISYPQSGPESLYDLGVPRSARVVDLRRGGQYIGTPGNEPMPVPTPEDSGSSRLVPLMIDLPRAVFVGTPQNHRVPRLAKPRSGPRPPFLAPPGTMNVALGKPVTCSDADPVMGRLEMITDGDKEAADGSFVELGPGLQHVTIDLKRRYEIFAVVVWHYHQQPRVYFDVVVQVSDDPRFRTRVRTAFNNDIDDSASFGRGSDLHYTETNEGRLIHTKGVGGRYVRLFSNGNTSDDLNHYIEVEVYGRPVQ